ncbi:MAG: hypothetical protein NVSMB39_0660 [Candidatus Saccharimonadales bacterium]
MNALLHSKTAAQIDGVRARGTGSVIFHGPRGLGKATAARELAAALNCLDGQSGGACAHCRTLAAGNFPDFLWVDRGDKASIGIEQVRGLISELSMRPFTAGATRVVVIDQAHLLTLEAQNALLKLLEEPPPSTLIILMAEQLQALLVTVRSRCRSVQFVRPAEIDVSNFLVNQHGLTGPAAASLAAAAAGAPGTAISLAQNPAEADALAALAGDAHTASTQSLFDRLLLVGRLVSAGVDLERFAEVLHRRVIAALTVSHIDPIAASARLEALERFRQHLAAKVSAKVALERLMMELG